MANCKSAPHPLKKHGKFASKISKNRQQNVSKKLTKSKKKLQKTEAKKLQKNNTKHNKNKKKRQQIVKKTMKTYHKNA